MAVTIRCSECHKKISIDAAFAGSMCRCPYCKSIVLVPKAATTPTITAQRQARPVIPTSHAGPAQSEQEVQSGVIGSRPIIQLVEDEIDKASLERETKIKSPLVVDDISHDLIGAASADKKQQEKKAVPDAKEKEVYEEEVQDIAGDIVLEAPAVDPSKLSEEELAAIPTANPIVFQGVVSIALILVLVVMIGACVFLGIRMFAGEEKKAKQDDAIYDTQEAAAEIEAASEAIESNPFLVAKGKTVVCGDVAVAGPIVYCIDGGATMNSGPMGSLYPLAKDIVRASVMGMSSSNKIAVMVAEEEKNNVITGKYIASGQGGEKALREKMLETMDDGVVTLGGPVDLDQMINTAAAIKPKTIVLVINQKNISLLDTTVKKLAEAKVKLVIVLLTATEDQTLAAEALAKRVGNGSVVRAYSQEEISNFYEENELP